MLVRIIHEHLLSTSADPFARRVFSRSVSSTDRKQLRYKKRPAHHLAREHERGALYLLRRAPCEKPTGTGASWRAWGGRVPEQASVSAAWQRHS